MMGRQWVWLLASTACQPTTLGWESKVEAIDESFFHHGLHRLDANIQMWQGFTTDQTSTSSSCLRELASSLALGTLQ